MAIDYKKLPVYEQKKLILESLQQHQVVVVQSPTGSGKTTQIPVILYEAGFAEKGMIAVTQPRRIAALSVSEFIAKQLKTSYPGLVGYKMRFEDKTDSSTKIKIMTDGILLQEMKLDPWLSKYSVIMIDEAHERSLNIDFCLGLLKRVLQARKDFKVIVSSATINAKVFSDYFDNCPIVTIDTQTFPVTLIYDPPSVKPTTSTEAGSSAILQKIENIIDRVLYNKEQGDILVFLPGEKIIKDCIEKLSNSHFRSKIHIVPLYGRLSKEMQEKVFLNAPFGKKKVVISTNIAETSVTINGITTVIDTGLAKLNFYNPFNYTSSLIETAVSKASCNQRKGRAGRTCSGTCYRLYSRKDFEARQEYTTEEIFRTDLSEVVLRMSELGITDFEDFDFISKPEKENLKGAVQTLFMLNALNEDNTLSSIGKLMVEFPLEPRVSRILVESILKYPDVLEESVIAAAFLSTHSPFILPPGQEMDARAAHHAFRDLQGDFVSYVKLFRKWKEAKDKKKFAEKNFLDEKVMTEIESIVLQLEEEISALGIPVSSGGNFEHYLSCIAAGMIQFVCVRESKDNYRSMTAEHISIHPGSGMFKTTPLYIVAGEIVHTSRTFAMSVSPITKTILNNVQENLEKSLLQVRSKKLPDTKIKSSQQQNANIKVELKRVSFEIKKAAGKQLVFLPYKDLKFALSKKDSREELKKLYDLNGILLLKKGTVLKGEKVGTIVNVFEKLNLDSLTKGELPTNKNLDISEQENLNILIANLRKLMRIYSTKQKNKEYSFITLSNPVGDIFYFKLKKEFTLSWKESLSSLENLIDNKNITLTSKQKSTLNDIYRFLNNLNR